MVGETEYINVKFEWGGVYISKNSPDTGRRRIGLSKEGCQRFAPVTLPVARVKTQRQMETGKVNSERLGVAC